MNKIADIGFYFFISILSIYFYTRVLSAKYTEKTTKLLIGACIFASHLILLIPAEWEIIFNVIQMIGEFVIISIFTKDKPARKLIAYVEMNIATGMGAIGADFVFSLDLLKGIVVFTESGCIQKIFFYSVVILITYIILTVVISLKEKTRKFIHIQGMEILVCMTLEMLCFLYVTGMIMLETKDLRNIQIIFIFVALVMLISIFIKLSDYIKEKENIYMEYYVMKNVMGSTEYIIGRLKEEEQIYRQQMEAINKGLCEAYEAAEIESMSDNVLLNVLLENKKKKAKMEGADMDISLSADKESMLKAQDCITIAANLLDNAIEAVSQNHVNNRDIMVRGHIGETDFFFQVKNPYEREPVIAGGELVTTKDNREGHGYGLKSVRRIAEEYGMSMEVDMKDGVFCVTVGKKL